MDRPLDQVVPHTFRSLASALDAVDIARPAIGPATLAVALLDDRTSGRGVVVRIEATSGGGDELSAVDILGDVVCRAVDAPGCRVALVSPRPPGVPVPQLVDLELWDGLVARYERSPVELLDWIVLCGPFHHVSMADELGPGAAW